MIATWWRSGKQQLRLVMPAVGFACTLCMNGAITSGNSALAQNITLDGSLSPAQTLTGPTYVIPQAVGQTAGSNLFHSFGQFNLNTGESATFQSAANIQNILSRVTGGSPSSIDGRIFTTSSSVNLFLINPSGIVFGSNARIDVGGATRGSFIATTANALEFGSTGAFVASTSQNDVSLLTVNPSAFLFNQIAAAPITSQARLEGKDGQSLLLVGGNVQLNGGILKAPGGRVELGGVAGEGTVGLNVDGNTLSLSVPERVARADVSLTNGAEVDVAAGGGGSIAINARNIDVLQESGLRAGISPLSGSDGAQAGDITLSATGTTKIENGFIYNAAFDTGNGGNLRIDAGQLLVRDGVVATATVSEGRAGDLIVNASDVNLTGSPSSNGTVRFNIPVEVFGFTFNFPITAPIGLFSATLEVRDIADVPINLLSGGNAGNLTINTERLIVRDGAVVSAGTASTGQAGDLTVNASDFVELSGTSANDAPPGTLTVANRVPSGLRNETSGLGVGGQLTVNTRRLIVRDGAWVTAGTAGDQRGGNLTVRASDSVELSGTAAANGLPSVLAAGTQGSGDAGDLTITTGRFVVRDGAVVSAGTSGDGQGGDLTVKASDSVELIGTSNVGLTADLLQALVGAAGVSLVGVVENLPYPSGVITGTAGTGDAGNLTIDTGRLVIRDGAQASVSTVGAGNAGRLKVRASEEVELSGAFRDRQSPNAIIGPSLLTTAVSKEATGNGGDLIVETGRLTIRDGARLSAETSGTGGAGNISVQKADSVSVSNGSISTAVNSGAVGEGGDITIESGSISLTDGAQVSAETSGAGRAGNISVQKADSVSVSNGSISTAVNFGAVGEGGDITIESGSVSLSDGAQLRASTSGQGSSGKIQLNVSDGQLLVKDSSISTAVNSTGVGEGGDVQIEAGSVSLTDGARVLAETSGTGRAGNISVQKASSVSLSGSSISTAVNSTGVGDGGDVQIAAGSVSLTDGAQVRASTSGQGSSGKIQLNVSNSVNLSGTAPEGFSSGLFTTTEEGASGQGGNITVDSNALYVSNGAVLDARTRNAFKGGTITVNTNILEATGGGQLLTTALSTGDAGAIAIDATDRVTLSGRDPTYADRLAQFGSQIVSPDGPASGLSARTLGAGVAGDLSITTRQLLVQDGAQVSAATEGTGRGGTLSVNAPESVKLIGSGSGLFAQSAASGEAGNLAVTTGQLVVRDGAQVTVSAPQGQAGNLTVTANSVRLNQGSLFAETAKSGAEGGANITLNGLDFLRLDNESLISANALDQANGGNITIDSTFIVATPPTGPQGSDITANAVRGNGGRVSITTQGLFGIEFRPQRTPKNDITVSSEFGLTGEFQLNSPDVDPSRGLTNLPTDIVDASNQIAQNCSAGGERVAQNQFIITGRGGLPDNPGDTLSTDAVWTDLRTPTAASSSWRKEPVAARASTSKAPIVEANGWVMNDNGEVVLIATAPTVTPHSPALKTPECRGY